MYQAVVRGGQRAFNMALMDALQEPVVESIYLGRVGDPIIVRATDDFKIAGIVPRQQNTGYTGSKITVAATFLPGNSASLSINAP